MNNQQKTRENWIAYYDHKGILDVWSINADDDYHEEVKT
jgi:hypothetical protein